MQVGGSQEDLQGVSPSSTIRDLEAACGPLSAASGPLDASALPPAKDAAIMPLLWARFTATLALISESPYSWAVMFPLTALLPPAPPPPPLRPPPPPPPARAYKMPPQKWRGRVLLLPVALSCVHFL